MREINKSDKMDWQSMAKFGVVFLALLIGEYLLEKDHLLRSSVKDDMNLSKIFCNMNFFETIFSHGYKFRPVSNAAIWIIAKICNGNLYLFGYINILIAAFCAFIIFYLMQKNSNSYIFPLLVSILYIVSRFSYYQITTQLGVMESISTLLGILFIWYLFQYMSKLQSKDYYIALTIYALCSLSHERYLVLMPVMIYAWFVSEDKGNVLKKENLQNYKKPILTIVVFAMIMLAFKFLVNNIMTGTGGTVVTETVSIKSVISQIFMSIGYILSVNSSETYLSMVGWSEYTIKVKAIVIISIIMIFMIIAISVFEIIKMEKAYRKKTLSIIGMFILSIGAMIFISSVTIRVELRWMYMPYMAAVFLLVYLTVLKSDKFLSMLKQNCFYVYVISMIIFGVFCRNGYYNRLYYWNDYSIANKLTDATYGIYGDEMYSKSWVIIVPFELTNSYSDLMKQFDVSEQNELNVEVIASIKELVNVADIQNKEILYYDEEKVDFINITNMVKKYMME